MEVILALGEVLEVMASALMVVVPPVAFMVVLRIALMDTTEVTTLEAGMAMVVIQGVSPGKSSILGSGVSDLDAAEVVAGCPVVVGTMASLLDVAEAAVAGGSRAGASSFMAMGSKTYRRRWQCRLRLLLVQLLFCRRDVFK